MKFNSRLGRDYEVPKKSIFLLDEMELVQSPDAAAFISNSVTDSVMFCTNGYIGLRHRTDTDTVGFATGVMLNGVYHVAPRDALVRCAAVTSDTQIGAKVCSVNLDCLVDGESGTLSRIPQRKLSLIDGAYRSKSPDVLSSDGGLTYDADYVRTVSADDIHVWGAEVCIRNIRMTPPLSSSNSETAEPAGPSPWSSYPSVGMESMDPHRNTSPSPRATSKHASKLVLEASIAVELDSWEVIKANPLDELWQRSLTSNIIVNTFADVFCTIREGEVDSVCAAGEVDMSTCADTSFDADSSPMMDRYSNSMHAKDRESSVSVSGGADPLTPVRNGSSLYYSFSKKSQQFIIKKRFTVMIIEGSEPTSVFLTFKARHSTGTALPKTIHLFPTIEDMVKGRRERLEKFWSTYDIDLQLMEELIPNRTRLALMYNAFRLFCMTQGLETGFPRAGCSAPGEALQYDLRQYINHGLYYLLTQPNNTLSMIKSLYNMLPEAKKNAACLSLPCGAFYPQCTMVGTTSVSYNTITNVRFHINAEIGFLIFSYNFAVESISLEDRLLLLETMLETARIWVPLGKWSAEKSVFRLDNLSSLDDYNYNASGNFYIHLSAMMHMKHAVEMLEEHERVIGLEAVEGLLRRISMSREEVAEMLAAAKAISLHQDERTGAYLVHDDFHSLTPWRGERAKHPLHLNYHPLAIFRQKLVDVPEVLMGMLMYNDCFERHEFERNFNYYEPLCTYDSPEGLALMAVAQCRARQNFAQPIPQLRSLLHLDLDNISYSSKEGLQFGAMSSSLLTFLHGVGGVTISKKNLHINPLLPAGVTRYTFTICWRGAVLKTKLDRDALTYELVEGDSLRFIHGPSQNRIHLHNGYRRCQATRRLTIPRVSFSQVGQFDGAVFLSDCLFHNILEYSYVSWLRTLESLFENYRTLHNRPIPQLSPEEYIEKVVYQLEEEGIAFSGIHQVLLDRGINLDIGTPDDAEIVETRYGLANAKVAEMSELLASQYPPVNPDLFTLIRGLARSGVALAIVTYSRSLKQLMQHHTDLASYFVARIDGEEAHDRGIKGRPHLDLFTKAAEKIHVDPSRCIVIGHNLDRHYRAEDLGTFRMFLDVDEPFVSSRIQPSPYPTLSEAYMETHHRDNPVVCRLGLDALPTTVDQLEDIIDGRPIRDPLKPM